MLTFISSAKPQGSEESDLNQKIALQTWVEVCDQIVFFNKAQENLRHPKVIFIEGEEYPEMFRLVHLAQKQTGWIAILNADIRIKSKLIDVIKELERRKMNAATSWRWQISNTPGESEEPRVIDNGLDFFLARPEVWAHMETVIPKSLRIGSNQWDSFFLSHFATYQTEWYADLTPAKVVFHPIHGNRVRGPEPQGIQLMSWPVQSPLKIQ